MVKRFSLAMLSIHNVFLETGAIKLDKLSSIAKVCICFSLLVIFAVPCRAQTDNVTVEFYLTIPSDTSPDAVVYLADNLNQTGSWKPNGVAMKKLDEGRFYLKLELPQNRTLEFKFTLGSWETVEKDQDGADISNRRLLLDENKTVNLSVNSWGAGTPGENIGNSLTGNFKYHQDFASDILVNKRTIIVYLPPGYQDKINADHRYPVLYMHDGQNIFDRATGFGGQEWKIDETADTLIKTGSIEPIIIVGIYNTRSRMTEYTVGAESPSKGRSGEEYTQFLVKELKPFIDKNYRTQPGKKHTAVAGSSLGGLISLYIAMSQPETFGMSGVISASLFWNNRQLTNDVEKYAPQLKNTKFWVDMGAREGRIREGDTASTSVLNARLLIEKFHQAKLAPGKNYFYLEVPQGEHNERSWAQRMDKMLLYFFSK